MTPLFLFPHRETREQALRRIDREIRDLHRASGEAAARQMVAAAHNDDADAEQYREQREGLAARLAELREERASWMGGAS